MFIVSIVEIIAQPQISSKGITLKDRKVAMQHSHPHVQITQLTIWKSYSNGTTFILLYTKDVLIGVEHLTIRNK